MQSTEKRSRLRRNTIETFWENVTPTGACWTWDGRLTHEGYATYSISGKNSAVHRIAYEYLTGETIAPGLHLDHLCRTRNCVNPDHLEPVTPLENSLRAQKPRTERPHCINGHEWTPENTLPQRNSKRCRQCVLIRGHAKTGAECTYESPCASPVHQRAKYERSETCAKGHSMENAYIRGNGERMCGQCQRDRTKQRWDNTPKVACDCGAVVAKCNLKAHTKTDKHAMRSALRCKNEGA